MLRSVARPGQPGKPAQESLAGKTDYGPNRIR